MPSDMRSQCPLEDTPPSTRPPSVASSSNSSGTPHRSTSMDSLNTSTSTTVEKPSGEEYIPTRMIKTTPKTNTMALQFIKTGPAMLHKSAKEQMKKAEVVKSLRKTSLQEEEEWQVNPKDGKEKTEDAVDWQANLDKWKSSRRKRNEEILERVIEIKKNEQEEEFAKTRRKSKTFNEMREEKNRRGRRYNLVIHDDDNNDLSDLGLTSKKNRVSPTGEPSEEGEAKSDAGFCTGSDTGSDGLFPEDNISDTSSALGDKREVHDSLLESRISPTIQRNSIETSDSRNIYSTNQDTEREISKFIGDATKNVDENHNSSKILHINQEKPSVANENSTSHSPSNTEYTYDKAIEDYKQFAENSARKRSSVSSCNLESSLNSSNCLFDEEGLIQLANSSSSASQRRVSDKSKISSRFVEPRAFESTKIQSRSPKKERLGLTKVDIGKRRSMFELRDVGNDNGEMNESKPRKSVQISDNLKNKVASFENIYSKTARMKRDDQSATNDSKLACFEGEIKKPKTLSISQRGNLGKSLSLEIDEKFSNKLETFKAAIEDRSIQLLQEKDYQTQKTLNTNVDVRLINGIDKMPNQKTNLSSPTRDYDNSVRVPPVEVESKLSNSLHSTSNFTSVKPFSAERSHFVGRSDYTAVLLKNQNNEIKSRGINANSPSLHASGAPPDCSSYLGFSKSDSQKLEDELSTREYDDQDIDEVINYCDLSPDEVSEGFQTRSITDFSSRGKLKEDDTRGKQFGNNKSSGNFRSLSTESSSRASSSLEAQKFRPSSDIGSALGQSIDDLEVIDITWSEDDCYTRGPLTPPSVPPPPPPVEEEDDDIEVPPFVNSSNLELSTSVIPSTTRFTSVFRLEGISPPARASSPIKSTKEELRKKKAAFLGTNPSVVEECSIKPPPDVSEILRRERESERLIVQKQASLRQESSLANSTKMDPNGLSNRNKYTWEDRMKADDTRISDHVDLNDSSDQFEFQEKLAELELEMERHDRDMMQRVQPPSRKSNIQMPEKSPRSDSSSKASTPSKFENSSFSSAENSSRSTNSISIRPFYSAPSYKKVESPSSNTHATRSASVVSTAKAILNSHTIPETKSSGTPKTESNGISTSASTLKAEDSVPPRKKNIRALSALPKPKLTENESWITKRKTEGKRDYNKHWLFQEAEQRRLEQQERITRPSDASALNRSTISASSSSFLTSSSRPVVFSSHHNYNQNVNNNNNKQSNFDNYFNVSASSIGSKTSSCHSAPSFPHRTLTKELSNSNSSFGSSDSTFTHNSNSYLSANNYNNNVNGNGSMRNSPLTYQPSLSNYQSNGSNKPLPDAIINSITQRVQNKNKINAKHRGVDEHSDYANSEAFVPHSHDGGTPSPSSASFCQSVGSQPKSSITASSCHSPQQITNNKDDQCLLSVSGKKKCSHCSEELGRGAAMIIESLRLFYHIPCFKCCVCGVQLGNGTSGADVRVRNHKLHCHNCYSNDEGMKFSKV